MTTRERIHTMVDALADADLDLLQELISSLEDIAENDIGPQAAKPTETIDGAGNLSAMRRASSVGRLRQMCYEQPGRDYRW